MTKDHSTITVIQRELKELREAEATLKVDQYKILQELEYNLTSTTKLEREVIDLKREQLKVVSEYKSLLHKHGASETIIHQLEIKEAKLREEIRQLTSEVSDDTASINDVITRVNTNTANIANIRTDISNVVDQQNTDEKLINALQDAYTKSWDTIESIQNQQKVDVHQYDHQSTVINNIERNYNTVVNDVKNINNEVNL